MNSEYRVWVTRGEGVELRATDLIDAQISAEYLALWSIGGRQPTYRWRQEKNERGRRIPGRYVLEIRCASTVANTVLWLAVAYIQRTPQE